MNEFLEANNLSTCDYVVKDNFEAVNPCLVCGEDVIVSMYGPHVIICEKCKEAILHMREQLESVE